MGYYFKAPSKRNPPPAKQICVIIAGLPGSGKGSLCKFLCEHYKNLHHLSTGEIFRAIKANLDHPLHLHIKELLDNNQLIDDSTTYEVLKEALKAIPKKTILLLDGFPRTYEQAKWICNESSIYEQFEYLSAFRLEVSLKDCQHLMLEVRKRESDTPEKVPARLMEESINLTMGVYRVLRDNCRLVKIQGYPRSLAEIAYEVANHLKLTHK